MRPLLIACVLLAGCERPSYSKARLSDINKLEGRLERIEKKIDKLSPEQPPAEKME
jgi:hypothetical protein